MTVLNISTPEAAAQQFRDALNNKFQDAIFTDVEIGDWVNPEIHLPCGNSDITAPFMEAFLEMQHAIYVIAAEIIHGSPDVRRLTAEESERLQIRFKVTPGSSNFAEPLGEALKTLIMESVGKLSAKQIVMMATGGAILMSGLYGFATHSEHRKEVRLAEIKSEERRAEIENSRFAHQEMVDLTKFVAEKMAQQGGAPATVVDESTKTNAALLRAIALTGDATVNGVHVTKAEADALRHNKRRSSDESIIERLVTVVEINTTDKKRTTVELRGIGKENVKVTFADRMIEDRDLNKLHRSLRDRKPVRVKLEVRRVGDEIRSAEILRVVTPRGN